MPLRDHVLRDLRFAARALYKSPGVTAIAALSLGLGIGANTAVFSFIDSVLLRFLPVQDPESLVLLSDPGSAGVSQGAQAGERSLFSYQEFERIRAGQKVFESMFASQSSAARLTASIAGGAPEDVRLRLVSGAYFSTLGVKPAIGRAFTAADDRAPGAAPYAVLSYAYWSKRFGGWPGALGSVIKIRKAQLTVIGVAPKGFFGETVGEAPDIWVPIVMQPEVMPGRDWLHDDERSVERVMWLHVMGRLKPGVTMKQAQANISVAWRQILNAYQVPGLGEVDRKELLGQTIRLKEGGKGAGYVRDSFAQALFVLMAVVGLVLLIACVNIANLLLARAAARQKEISVRLAVGATSGRIAAQLLTESVLLALLGGALGVLGAIWGVRVLLRVVSSGPEALPLAVHLDLRILAFTAAVSLFTGILFGVAPAFHAARADVAAVLKDNARGLTGGGGRLNLGKLLVTAQIALSVILLVGAGLFLQTLWNLHKVDLGYARGNLIVVNIESLSAGYKGSAALDLYNRLVHDFRSIPGVKSATYSENGLFSGTESGTLLDIQGYTPKKRGDTAAAFDQVGPNYFSTVGIPLLQGREIGSQDTSASTHVCVINEAFAKRFFQGRNPIGQRIRDLFPGSTAVLEIVGVAANARDHNVRGEIPPRFYSGAAHPLPEVSARANFEIRTLADPGTVISAVRSRVRAMDPSLTINSAETVDTLVGRRLTQDRIVAQLSAFFGALALLLAAVGIYGVLSYAVERRTNEIGIRMAIGAGRDAVVLMILRETAALIATGGVAGVAASVALGRLVASRM
jgi:predicted permease